jgi:hypothetical protein
VLIIIIYSLFKVLLVADTKTGSFIRFCCWPYVFNLFHTIFSLSFVTSSIIIKRTRQQLFTDDKVIYITLVHALRDKSRRREETTRHDDTRIASWWLLRLLYNMLKEYKRFPRHSTSKFMIDTAGSVSCGRDFRFLSNLSSIWIFNRTPIIMYNDSCQNRRIGY